MRHQRMGRQVAEETWLGVSGPALVDHPWEATIGPMSATSLLSSTWPCTRRSPTSSVIAPVKSSPSSVSAATAVHNRRKTDDTGQALELDPHVLNRGMDRFDSGADAA